MDMVVSNNAWLGLPMYFLFCGGEGCTKSRVMVLEKLWLSFFFDVFAIDHSGFVPNLKCGKESAFGMQICIWIDYHWAGDCDPDAISAEVHFVQVIGCHVVCILLTLRV